MEFKGKLERAGGKGQGLFGDVKANLIRPDYPLNGCAGRACAIPTQRAALPTGVME